MNHYETLGLDPKTATDWDIKNAWRKLSSLHHPDRPTGNAEKMAAINKAYEVLGNPQLKAHYDETGESELTPPAEFAARTALCLAFMEVVTQAIENCDLISETYNHLGNKLAQTQANINGAHELIGNLQRRANRIKIKAVGADNFLVAAIEQRIANTTPALDAAKAEALVLARAREMCLEYKDVDALTRMQRVQTTSFIDSGSTIGHIAFQWPEGS